MKRSLVALMVLVACACASIPVKEKATISLQGAESVLGTVQDTERQLCDPVKAAAHAVITECVGPTASAVSLTTERHRTVAAALAKAFDAQVKAATALQAWRSGDPAPAGLAEISAAATQALAIVRQLVTTSPQVQDMLTKLQAILDQVVEVNNLLKGR